MSGTDAETWRPIVGYEGLYEVSDQGRIRSLPRSGTIKTAKIRKLNESPNGYLGVHLYRSNQKRRHLVHRVVLEAFVGPCPPGHECRHLNGEPSNNRLSNLAWGSKTENMADRDEHGSTARGERVGLSKLTEAQVRAIRADSRTLKRIAADYGVSFGLIGHIRHRRVWGHVQ